MLNSVLREAFNVTGHEPPQKYIGSHLLRHSLATDMLRKGVSIDEIGDVLQRDCARSLAIGPSRESRMNTLTERLDDYLAFAGALGSTCPRPPASCVALRRSQNREGTDHITVELFLRWKAVFRKADNNTWSTRLGMVRVFARWLQAHDRRTEVPPTGLIVGKPRRVRPYIYSDEEIVEIVTRAASLSSRYELRGWTLDLVRVDRRHGAADQRGAEAR